MKGVGKMKTPKFSIIIPVYNAEKTISHTISLLMELEFNDYEVIIVNDGSTDATEQVISELVQGNDYFHFITTENQGPGAARNEGLVYARGEYVLFFDADDTPKKDVLKNYEQILSTQPATDLIISSFVFRTLNGTEIISEKEYLVSDFVYQDNQCFLNDMYELMSKQLMYVVWNKCYKREILEQHQIRFKNYSSCEDRIFNLDYYQYCQQVVMNSSLVYTYDFEGGKGITNQYKENKFATFKEFYELTNFITKNQDKSGMAALLLKGATSVIFSIYETETLTKKEKKQEAVEILHDPVIIEAKAIALTDSTAKKVTKFLYNMPITLFLLTIKIGAFVEVKLPGLMSFLKRVY